MKKEYVVELTKEEREYLHKLISSGSAPVRKLNRARILLKAEELALVSSAYPVAADHLVPFCYLVLHRVGEVGGGGAELFDFAFYGVCSPYLSCLAVGVIADEVGVEHLVNHVHFPLAEAFFQQAAHLGLVLFRHRGLLSPLLLLSVLEPYPVAGG